MRTVHKGDLQWGIKTGFLMGTVCNGDMQLDNKTDLR